MPDPAQPFRYWRRDLQPLTRDELVRNYRTAVERMPNVAKLRARLAAIAGQ